MGTCCALQPRPVWVSGLLLAVTLPLGLFLRFAPVGWPWAVAKYGGSVTWALMVYWLVSAVTGRMRLGRAFLLAGFLATGVELLKLWHTPGLVAFRRTLPGILLLGRHFGVPDLVAYWLAIAVGTLTDSRIRRALEARPPSTQVAYKALATSAYTGKGR